MVDNQQVEQATPTVDELRRQHQGHEQRLEELNKKAWLTPDEEMEAKRLKKLKLRLKDQIAFLEPSDLQLVGRTRFGQRSTGRVEIAVLGLEQFEPFLKLLLVHPGAVSLS